MALFHRATITPTKEEIIGVWAPDQPWGPPRHEPIDVIGSYRFDDPEGRAGMETFLFRVAGELYQAPLTYRDAPLEGSESSLIAEMTHSVLGPRWVYDGIHDPRFLVMLAAVSMSGQGEALGMAVYEGRWHVAPSPLRIRGGGWTQERVPVDHFELVADGAAAEIARLRNDRFDLTLFRHPRSGVAVERHVKSFLRLRMV
jgi:hypothetical protein